MWQCVTVTDVLDSVQQWLTVPDAAEVLGIPAGKVRRLIEEHHLVALKRDGVQKIPADVIVNGEPLPSLPGTIVVLLDAGLNYQEAIEWLYTFNDALPGTPIEYLLKGHKSPVRRLAMMLAL